MDFKNIVLEKKVKKGLYLSSKDRVFLEGVEFNRAVDFRQRIAGVSDYAIACGADRADRRKSPSGHFQGNAWLTTPYVETDKIAAKSIKNQYVYFIDDEGKVGEYAMASADNFIICPAFELNLEGLESPTGLFKDFEIGERRLYYHTIKFKNMAYPQSKVDEKTETKLELAYQTKNLYRTGKSYCGRYNDLCELDRNEEFFFEGQRYVRAVLGRNGNFNDGSKHEKEKAVWLKVEPIVFAIRNWEDLPTSINPKGSGEAKSIVLRSEDGLLSGIPFDLGMNSNKWEKSIIRYYLNGSSGKANSFVDDRGKAGFKKTKTYDFTENGFLEQAYCDEKTLIANMTKEKTEQSIKSQDEFQNKVSPRPFEVTIDNSFMSVNEQLRFYVENGKSFMLHGPSGVGKSRRIREIDHDCVILQLRNGLLPEEIVGKTAYDSENGKAEWIAPTWYDRICDVCAKEPYRNHVLFIDEITNVRPNEQSLVYNIILNRTIDGQNGKLPKNCVVAAAGNSTADSNAAYNLVEPLFRRFYAHIDLNVDMKEFLIWGSEKKSDGRLNIHPIVAAFIAKEGENVLFSKYNEFEGERHSIDPRGWEQVSNIIYDNGEVLKIELIANKIGPDLAGKFVKFAKTPIISSKMIINKTFDEKNLPNDENSIIALILRLRYAKEKDVIREFIESHFDKEKLEFYDNLTASETRNEKEMGG